MGQNWNYIWHPDLPIPHLKTLSTSRMNLTFLQKTSSATMAMKIQRRNKVP
jgi:hypothetical protein